MWTTDVLQSPQLPGPIKPNMLFSNLLVCLLATAIHAAPAASPLGVNIGVKFDKRQDDLPTLTLPYGTWRASDYNADADVGKAPPTCWVPD